MRRRTLRWSAPFAAAFVAAALLTPSRAFAQLHWDAALQAGAAKRTASDRPQGADDVGIGPVVEAHAHVALLPLLRVGGYVSGEVSPSPEPEARRMYAAGLRAKLAAPWIRGAFRAWVFAGLGYVGVYAPSFTETVALTTPSGPVAGRVLAPGAGGHFFEVPVGIGGAYRFRKPWEITAELTGRIGFGFGGTVYAAEGRPASGIDDAGLPITLAPVGNDVLSIGLLIGIGIDD